MTEPDRLWNKEAELAYDGCIRYVSSLPELDKWPELYKRATAALDGNLPHALCRVLKASDETIEDKAHTVRFSIAMQAMKLGKYTCAYAAWDDGGRCWSDEPVEPMTPGGRYSASIMMDICDELIEAINYKELALCDMMKGMI